MTKKKKHNKSPAEIRAESRSQEAWSYAFSASIVLLAVVTAAAARQSLRTWEISIFQDINNMSDAWRPFWLMVTQFGSAWALLLAVIGAWLYGRRGLATDLFLHGFITYFLVQIAKQVVARPRPELLLDMTNQREIFLGAQYGFPSGHTAVAAALSLTLWPYLPKTLRFIVPVWICLVAVSRIYLGVHIPLDIVGGLALGTAVVAMGHVVSARRIVKT